MAIERVTIPRRTDLSDLNGPNKLRSITFFEGLGNQVNNLIEKLGNVTVAPLSPFTTIGSGTIICTAVATINLNARPADTETLRVIRTNGLVTVEGNGKIINKTTSRTLSNDETALTFFYSFAQDQWYII